MKLPSEKVWNRMMQASVDGICAKIDSQILPALTQKVLGSMDLSSLPGFAMSVGLLTEVRWKVIQTIRDEKRIK